MKRAWNRFFHEPVDTLPLAICRIVHGVVALLTAAFLFPDRFVWFGDRGLVSLHTASAASYTPLTSIFRWTGDPEPFVTPLLIVMMIAALTFTIGLFTRTSAAIVFFILLALQQRTPAILNGADILLRINMLLFAFSDAGSSLALDRRTPGAPWPQRLMQIQLTIVYLASLLWKLDGMAWLLGTAMYYVLSLAQFQKWPNDGFFVPLAVSKILSRATLAAEAAAATLIWIPRYRNIAIISAALLHLGIELTLNVPFFEWLMLGTLVLFIEPAALRRGWWRVRARRREASPGRG